MNKFNLCAMFSVLLWLFVAVYVTSVEAQSIEEEPVAVVQKVDMEDIALEAMLLSADLDKPASEPETYEDWFRKNATKIDECTITHYCSEKRKHICGTGDGITATEVPVTPYWTCAVDPDVIPLGSEVMVDYGDSVAFYKAQDIGCWVNGNHIDLAVETHEEALGLGVLVCAVYFLEE